jgi:hypothetical protein
VGLFVGWFAIAVHQNLLAKAAVTNIQAALLNGSLALSPTTPADFLAKEVNMEKGRIIANRTFVQRFFSIKTLHGVLMTGEYRSQAANANGLEVGMMPTAFLYDALFFFLSTPR